MWRASAAGGVYLVCGLFLGVLALLIFVTKFNDWTSGWGVYNHIFMLVAAVGSVACVKSARVSFVKGRERPHDPIGQPR